MQSDIVGISQLKEGIHKCTYVTREIPRHNTIRGLFVCLVIALLILNHDRSCKLP